MQAQPDQATTPWLELRRMADELEVQIHLASMELRDRWYALQPRLDEVSRAVARSDEFVTQKIAKLTAAIAKLRDEVAATRAPHKPW